MMRHLLPLSLFTVLALPLLATHPQPPFHRDPALYERILIPIFVTETAEGVHGSRWTQTVTVHNGSSEEIVVDPYFCATTCPPNTIVPGATAPLSLGTLNVSPTLPGVFVFIPRSAAEKVTISERIHELTRASMTWGTEIPIVRERDWRTGTTIQLQDVPLGDPAFRVMVRVYLAPPPGCGEHCPIPLQIDVFEQSGHPSVADRLVYEHRVETGFFHHWTGFHPAYVQLPDLASRVPGLMPLARYRIAIRTGWPDAPFWAFAAITNNETQHVTVATPR